MITKKLQKIIDGFDEKLNQNYEESLQNKKENILASSIKLSEEVGELSGEVLKFIGRARKDKLKNFSKESLEGEFADVMFSLLVLAKTMGVDINEALENKFEKIKKRGGV